VGNQPRRALAGDRRRSAQNEGAARDENALASAKRELLEEAGVIAARWLSLPEIHPSNGASDEVALPFIAWELAPTLPAREHSELIRIEWVPFWHVVERIEEGRIRDATSVVAVLHVAPSAIKDRLPEGLARAIPSI
jgi:8-oxo-dGTP pyrophosphatase MutT (NUDIX family)